MAEHEVRCASGQAAVGSGSLDEARRSATLSRTTTNALTRRSTHLGYAYIIAAALLWATIGPAARFALRAGLDPLEISFWRAAIGGVFFG